MRNAGESVSDAVNTALNVLIHSANTVRYVKIAQVITVCVKTVIAVVFVQLYVNAKQVV